MHIQKHSNPLLHALLAVSLAMFLSACGSDSDGIAGTTTSGSTSTPSSTSSGSGATGGTTTGSFDLTWTAPVSRADGTPLALSEIAGYRVYYGTSAGNYPNHIDITNGTLQSATLTGVPVGTYYVAMTTYDTSGLQSSYSAPVIKKAL
jgi:hypothetical protein